MVSLATGSSTQLSLATGAVQLTEAPHESAAATTLILVGQPVHTGLTVSSTVTLHPQVSALPEASVAMKVNVVTPTGNTAGEVLDAEN